MKSDSMPFHHILFAVLVTMVWGLNIPMVKLGLQELPPFLFTALRFLGLLALTLPWLRWRSGRMGPILKVALVLGPFHFGLVFLGIDQVRDGSVVAVIAQLSVPISTLLGVLVLGERIRFWRGLGVVLAFTGVMVMMFEPRVFDDWVGVLLLILAAFFYAISAVMLRRADNFSVFELHSLMALVSIPLLLGMSFVFEEGQGEAILAMSGQGYMALGYTVVVGSMLGHGLSFFLLQRNPVSSVTPYFLLTPVFGVFFSLLILNESLTVRMMAGGAITFAGIAVVTLRERRRALQKGH